MGLMSVVVTFVEVIFVKQNRKIRKKKMKKGNYFRLTSVTDPISVPSSLLEIRCIIFPLWICKFMCVFLPPHTFYE